MYLDVYFRFLEFKRKYSQLLTFWEQLNLLRVTGKLRSIGVQALSGRSRKMLTLRLTTLLLPKTVLLHTESFARLCIVLNSEKLSFQRNPINRSCRLAYKYLSAACFFVRWACMFFILLLMDLPGCGYKWHENVLEERIATYFSSLRSFNFS